MVHSGHQDYFTVSRLAKIPRLVHGFGRENLKKKDLKMGSEWRDFRHLTLKQTHSDIIRVIERYPEKKLEGDAMLTDCPQILLIITTADCLPVIMVDEEKMVIAAIHCGWRGTYKKIIQQAVQRLKDIYDSDLSSLLVAMGPCIGQGCYEVGEDVKQNFYEEGLSTEDFRSHPRHRGKYFFDLRSANRSQLFALGVKKKNIFSLDICTHCEKDLISFRRNREREGRMLNFIGIST